MRREQVIKMLDGHKATLSERFGVTDLALFGSTARDTASEGSDVDILVSFDGPANSKRYFGVQFYLEDLPGCPVDLVTEKSLRPELRPHVEAASAHFRARCATKHHGDRARRAPYGPNLGRLEIDYFGVP